MQISDLSRCALYVAVFGTLFVLAACHSGEMTPPGPAGPLQSNAAPASFPVQPNWKITRIASGFSGPLAVDAARNVYVPLGSDDAYQNDVDKIAPDGKITTVGHGFFVPDGVAVHNGYVYVADYGHNAIKRIAKNGMVSKVVGAEHPGSIAVGTGGSIYVVEIDACESSYVCIKRITPNRRTTTLLMTDYNVDNITLDTSANLYVAAYNFGRYGCCAQGKIYKITPRGNVSAHSFKSVAPESVTVDANANIYVGTVHAAFQDAAVYRIAPNGRETKIASLGGGDSYLQGLAFRYGATYVADAGVASVYSKIYKIVP